MEFCVIGTYTWTREHGVHTCIEILQYLLGCTRVGLASSCMYIILVLGFHFHGLLLIIIIHIAIPVSYSSRYGYLPVLEYGYILFFVPTRVGTVRVQTSYQLQGFARLLAKAGSDNTHGADSKRFSVNGVKKCLLNFYVEVFISAETSCTLLINACA